MEPINSAIEMQSICIHLLMELKNSELSNLLKRIKGSGTDSLTQTYLSQCVDFARERKKKPEYCTTFEAVVRKILVLQRKGENAHINSTLCGDAVGGAGRETLLRIRQGSETPKQDKVTMLCKELAEESDRIFWSNMLFSFFPRTGVLKDKHKDKHEDEHEDKHEDKHNEAFEGLKRLLEMMGSEQLERVREKLPEAENQKLTVLMGEWQTQENRLDETLYGTIEKLCKDSGETVERLVDRLGTTKKSWYAWRKNWLKEESSNFSSMPKPCIKRKHMLAMAVIFKLSYSDSIRFLYQGGYRLGDCGETGEELSEKEIITFLLGERKNEDEFIKKLIEMSL